jgi:hypothetical protein
MNRKQNSSFRYLKYAIGEIILVVIGILIALQINNWNETNKQIKIEKTFLKRLKIDLKQNLVTLDGVIKKQDERYKGVKVFIKYSLEQNIDSFRVVFPYFNSVLGWNDITIGQVTFEEMQNSGKLDIIRNDSIKIKLLQLDQQYQKILKRNANMKIVHEKFVSDKAFEILNYLDYIVLDRSKSELHPRPYQPEELRSYYTKMQDNILKLINDKVFMNSLVGTTYSHTIVIEELQDAHQKCTDLLSLVEKELDE